MLVDGVLDVYTPMYSCIFVQHYNTEKLSAGIEAV